MLLTVLQMEVVGVVVVVVVVVADAVVVGPVDSDVFETVKSMIIYLKLLWHEVI